MRPQTKYAKSGDIHIAYQLTGQGPVDIVWAPGTASHLDLDWELLAKARFIEKLSSFSRLIRFDKRGTGLSDRPATIATLEERTDDIRAVMDAARSSHAVILGASEGASMACVFAATFPHQTRSLMIWGGQARWVQADDYTWGLTPEESKQMIERIREQWPDVEYITGPGAGLGPDVDPAFLDWFMRYCQAAASPAAVVALEEMNAQIDVRSILPLIHVPALVMNRTGDPVAHIDAARDLAARIPGARFVEFPGITHSMFSVDPDRVLGEIQEFVTGTRPPGPSDRFLATILFVDLVGSTTKAAAGGDAAWRDLLARFYNLARRELRIFGGIEIDTAGDGLLARFDGPARAIRCAAAIRDEVRRMGIEMRAGLHTGEVEVLDDGKVSGVGVHIGARVAALAGAGEILVSSTVKDLVVGSRIEFDNRGTHVLKGVPGKWRLFALRAA